MICHYKYEKSADSKPVEGFFELDDFGHRELPASVLRYPIVWQVFTSYRIVTINTEGYPRMTITTNVTPLEPPKRLHKDPFLLMRD